MGLSITAMDERVMETFRTARIMVLLVLDLCKDMPGMEGETGGYLCVADRAGTPLVVAKIGEVDAEKTSKYMSFCQEKARRLADHPEHVASWQSRKPDEDQYGGAVSGDHYILSFSGLPELADEAVMLVTMASAMPWEFREDPWVTAERSANPYWPVIANQLGPSLFRERP